jgi:hypothetical protein
LIAGLYDRNGRLDAEPVTALETPLPHTERRTNPHPADAQRVCDPGAAPANQGKRTNLRSPYFAARRVDRWASCARYRSACSGLISGWE